ncbi:cation transporting ATPase C-terminal domain-containing protein [Streptomyces sp. NPDC017991]|uniref:cation transporting ATPase C-terminal domain-containing protein n=1 Tax=Streptomyces sp. NPDC017991 TaxID=3365026 RepID=UPI0037B8457D
MGGFLFTLWHAGWSPGDPTGAVPPCTRHIWKRRPHFVGIVACRIGTAFAARTDRASLFTVGVWTNRLLLWGIAFELAFTAAVVYAPPLQHIFGTAALSPAQLAVVAPFPLIVWGVDEVLRRVRRHRDATRAATLSTSVTSRLVEGRMAEQAG